MLSGFKRWSKCGGASIISRPIKNLTRGGEMAGYGTLDFNKNPGHRVKMPSIFRGLVEIHHVKSEIT